ncbi:MAG: GYDIA family GHMP kinase [Tenacibaculum sp.]
MEYYSNGKLLLTGEYLVLDGAASLAVPVKFGQNLTVQAIEKPLLIWESFTNNNTCWFKTCFNLPDLKLSYPANLPSSAKSTRHTANTLQKILLKAQALNANFLNTKHGFAVKTYLNFPQNWGLGSSSTLINNIALWAKVNPYALLWGAFTGSAYDIACAKHNTAIIYKLNNKKPCVKELNYQPLFANQLYFIHLNKKQNSRKGIAKYNKYRHKAQGIIPKINMLSQQFLKADSIKTLNSVIAEHEQVISSIIEQKTIKSILFSDYFGQIKSLGAWGGDFILATGNEDTTAYFKSKGFLTVLPFKQIIL